MIMLCNFLTANPYSTIQIILQCQNVFKSHVSGIYCCFYLVAMATDNQRQYFLSYVTPCIYNYHPRNSLNWKQLIIMVIYLISVILSVYFTYDIVPPTPLYWIKIQIFDFAIPHFRWIFLNDAQRYGLVITPHMKAWVPYNNMVVSPSVAYFFSISPLKRILLPEWPIH